MQVSSSLIAAQAAAREAQARFHAQIQGHTAQPAKAPPATRPAMAAVAADDFAPLPLKQVRAPAQAPAGAQIAGQARLGQHIDITV